MPNFIFCIHNHQPVGNFDHVIEDSYQKAYLPFLNAVSKYPSIKLSFHITGYLLDWLLENHREYIEMLYKMVKRGQVEMMGGGYYEPILAVIPPEDRFGQIRMMSERVEEIFGKRPRGMWLAERIWEPHLPVYLREAGMEYVVVDDYHFVKAGLRKEELTGYYITEDIGHSLKVFPGSERLRYIVPFELVDKFMENLRWVETLGKNPAAIFADDGEKFGTWPGTHQWVYKEGWLDKFLDTIAANKDLIKPVTFSEYIDSNEPIGRVYLPTTSYMEMGEWALPPEASEAYTNLMNEVKTWQDGERIKRFLQGGFWRNFFAKYPEANWMHKRMLFVSEGVRSQESEEKNLKSQISNLKSHLYKAQCNDAYWHGVFGGLYLPHLRRAVYENLIKAENLLEERLKAEEKQTEGKSYASNLQPSAFSMVKDFDADTFNEILVRTPKLNLFLSPHSGGSIVEIDYRPKAVNLSSTLSRWEEGYHHRVKVQGQKDSGETKSIHDLSMSKEENLDKYMFFDRYRRTSLIDHFLSKEETLDAFRMSRYEELGDFFNKPYERKGQGARGKVQGYEGARFILSREGKVKGHAAVVEKEIFVEDNKLEIAYFVKNSVPDSEISLRFGIEFNLIMPCCNGVNGLYDVPERDIQDKRLDSMGEITGIRHVGMVDKWTRMKLDFSFDKDTSIWRFPIETVSISEAGFERIFQGSCIILFWDIAADRTFETGFKLKMESI